MINKLAQSIEMSFSVPDQERNDAAQAKERLLEVNTKMKELGDHLDLMYNPFKKQEQISSEALEKKRGVLSRYAKQIKVNYKELKISAIEAIKNLNKFSSDTTMVQIINAFNDNFTDVKKSLEVLLDVLSNHKSPEFRDSILKAIEGCKKQMAQSEKLIDDRIINHIDTNILAKNWTGDNYQNLIGEQMPLVTKLYKERQDAIEGRNSPQGDYVPEETGYTQPPGRLSKN